MYTCKLLYTHHTHIHQTRVLIYIIHVYSYTSYTYTHIHHTRILIYTIHVYSYTPYTYTHIRIHVYSYTPYAYTHIHHTRILIYAYTYHTWQSGELPPARIQLLGWVLVKTCTYVWHSNDI